MCSRAFALARWMAESPRPLIRSRANPQFRTLLKIATSARERRKSAKTLLDGEHLLQAYEQTIGAPELLIVTPQTEDFARRRVNVRSITIAESLFAELSPVETPSGVLALIERPRLGEQAGGSMIALEAVQDPGNLGAILRSAAAAGFTRALLSPACADAWAPKTLRAGMGAHFVIQIEERIDLIARLTQARLPLFALSLDATENLYQTELRGDVIFMFGNEGAGLSDELAALATTRLSIPMCGAMESLNVAAAVSVCCFEKMRQELYVAG